MNTTLNKIREKSPCTSGWNTLLKSLDKTQADDEVVSFKYILDSNGIKDAIWCLRVLDYKDICLFCADVAELALPIFEAKYPDDKRPREAIEGIRKYQSGEIDLEALSKLKTAAYDAYAAAAVAYDAAAAVAYAYAAAAYDAYDAAAAAAYDAYDAAAAAVDAHAHAARKEQWLKIEKLFVKYFCELPELIEGTKDALDKLSIKGSE